MSCSNPFVVKVNGGTALVSCGWCMCCRKKRQAELNFLCVKELHDMYKQGQGCSFVTLTYDDVHIPVSSSGCYTLRKSHLQNFLKRFRINKTRAGDFMPFKFIASGQNGDRFGRPHYHLAFIGLTDVQVKRYVDKCWSFGLTWIEPYASGCFNYITNYTTRGYTNKFIKDFLADYGVESPFVVHSKGLGFNWILRNKDKIVKDGYCYNSNGKRYLYPSSVRRAVYKLTGVSDKPFVKAYLRLNESVVQAQGYFNLDDYNASTSYLKELMLYNKAISDGQAVKRPVPRPRFVAK